MSATESGQSIVETVVAVGITAIAMAAVLGGVIAASHRFGADPVQRALNFAVEQELRIAVDLTKYQGSTLSPAAIATTIPIPGASPISVHLTLAAIALADGQHISVSATSDADPAKHASAATVAGSPVPLPNATVTALPAAEPSGAP